MNESGCLSVESGLEFVDGLLKAVSSAEFLEKFNRSTHGVKRGDLQDARIVKVSDAFVLVFLEQGFEHGAGLLAVLGEDIALADILRPLTPGERRLVEGHVADEVEGVEVLAHFLGQRIEQQAFILQFFDDGLLALGSVPASEELIEAGEALAERLLRVVAQALGDQLAVFVEVFDTLGQDADRFAANVVFRRRLRDPRRDVDIGRLGIDNHLFIFAGFRGNGLFPVVSRRHIVRGCNRIILARFVDLHRLAVEIGVSEVVGGLAEVDQGEVVLLGVLVDACAAAHDLLELGHRSHFAVEDDEAAGLGVDTGGEQARGGDDDRILRFRVDEVADLGAAFGVIAGDTHDVALVLLDQVRVFVDEGLPHPRGVFGIHTEDDGFLEAVAAFFEELGHLPGDTLGALVDDQITVEVLLVVDAVFDLVAVLVGFALLRAVALDIDIEVDLDHLVGREEAVADAFLQRVAVHGFAEVVDIGDVFRLLRRGGEADLGGGGEVVEDLPPGGILCRAAPVTFVDDDEVEKVAGELPVELLAFLGAGDGLVECKVNLVGGVDAPMLLVYRCRELHFGAIVALDGLRAGAELRHGGAEGAEVVHHRLVDEDIAVGKEENALSCDLPSTGAR